MKTLISAVLVILTLSISAQTSSIFKKNDDLLAMNVQFKSKSFNSSTFASDNIKIDLKMSKYRDADDRKSAGFALLLGGIAFTTAAILESGDFKIYQGETARQIMLVVGIGLTITGAGISLSH